MIQAPQKIAVFFISGFILIGTSSCEMNWPWVNNDDDIQEEAADTSMGGEGALVQDSIKGADLDTLRSQEYQNEKIAQDSVMEDKQNEVRKAKSEAEQWRLVISSQPSRELAEGFVRRNAENRAEIIYVDELDTYRVVHSSHSNLQLAQQEYQRIAGRYPDAWLVRFNR